MMNDDEWTRCQDWFDKRNKVAAGELDKILDAKREEVASRVAKMSPAVALKLIEQLRDVPPAHIEQKGDSRDALAKWDHDDVRWRACQELADAYEKELQRRHVPHPARQ
jgi:hypothetical protein